MNNLDPLSPQSPDSQRRLLVALALAMVLTFAYTFLFGPKGPPPGAEGADAGQVAAVADAGTAPVAAPPPGPTGTPEPGPAVANGEAPPPPVRTVEARREQAHYVFSSQGAGLTSAELQGDKMREQGQISVSEGYKLLFGGQVPPPPQMNLAQPVPGQPLPLAVAITRPLSPGGQHPLRRGRGRHRGRRHLHRAPGAVGGDQVAAVAEGGLRARLHPPGEEHLGAAAHR